jgi:hypothetical protein
MSAFVHVYMYMNVCLLVSNLLAETRQACMCVSVRLCAHM